jgi:hypothetical protein
MHLDIRLFAAAVSLSIVLSSVAPVPASIVSAQRPPAGTATVTITGDVSTSGEFPTTLCGGPYLIGKGMAYQAKAGDWQITVASEQRASGKVPLNRPDGRVNVVVTVNGRGKSFVRGPRNPGTLVISEDFRKAEATFDLRTVVGQETAKLVATFSCQ